MFVRYGIDKYEETMVLDLRADSLHLPYCIDPPDIVKLCEKFAMREFQELINKCMQKAYATGELKDDDGHAVLSLLPREA